VVEHENQTDLNSYYHAVLLLWVTIGSDNLKKRMLKEAKSIGGVAENEIVESIDVVKQYQAKLRGSKTSRHTRIDDDELIGSLPYST
jgi:hypothetical protein